MLSPNIDVSKTLPPNGIIHFRILSVHDVNNFTVKLLDHYDAKNRHTRFDEYEDMYISLNRDLSEKKVYVLDPKVNHKYAVYRVNKDIYERCIVIKVLETERITKRASAVQVGLIDTGEKRRIQTTSLFELPDKYKDIPRQGKQVFLIGRTQFVCSDL